jgi:hypothetical protein
MFYFIAQGRCWFRENNDEAVALNQGDWVLSAKPIADLLFSEPDVEPVLSDDAFREAYSVGGERRVGEGFHRP